MIKVSSVFTRPSAAIEINGGVDPEVWSYINAEFVMTDPPKYVSVVYDYDSNGTTVAITTLWDSIESRDSFTNDAWLITHYHQPRAAYNLANGITEVTDVTEIAEDDPYVVENKFKYILNNHPDGKISTFEIVQI